MKKLRLKKQLGQSMVEYTIVMVCLVGLMGVAASEPSLIDELSGLSTAINAKNKGYAYAISLSDYPESEKLSDLSPEAAASVAKIQTTFNQINQYSGILQGQLPPGIPSSANDVINMMSQSMKDAIKL